MPPVAEALAGKRILVTGATGLTGMYTAVKLLRDVPLLAGVVVPVRTGATAATEHAEKKKLLEAAEAGAEERWARIVQTEKELFQDADLSKVVVLPIGHIEDLIDQVAANAARIGPVHGVLNILGDSALNAGDELAKRSSNCDAPFGLYEMCRKAPPGHPLHTVEGYVQTTTFLISEIQNKGAAALGEPQVLRVAERCWPVAEEMPGTGLGGVPGYIRAKKRLEALLQENSSASSAGRAVPVCVIRPSLIIGCSDLPGSVGPVGWSNQGNLNVPMVYFFMSGQPDPKTPVRCPLLPPVPFLEAAQLYMVPVDVVANQHIGALAMLMAHPERLSFAGPTLPVLNSAHDYGIRPFGFLDFLRCFPHFDEKSFDYFGPRGLRLLQRTAEAFPKGEKDGDGLRRDLRNFRIYEMLLRLSEVQVETGNLGWLERQMHPSDREKFPVTFTDRMDFEKVVRSQHDYFWRRLLAPSSPKL